MNLNDKVINCNGWLYDQEKYPVGECLYVIASNKEAIVSSLTEEEMSQYKYFVYVDSTHHFEQFDMPHFDIIFLDGWKKHMHSRRIDFAMINFAVKHSLKVLNYKGGEHGELLDIASNQKEAKFHGFIQDGDKPIDSVKFHPEVMHNQPEHLKFE